MCVGVQRAALLGERRAGLLLTDGQVGECLEPSSLIPTPVEVKAASRIAAFAAAGASSATRKRVRSVYFEEDGERCTLGSEPRVDLACESEALTPRAGTLFLLHTMPV